jgi:hypothetical protein
MERKVFFVMTLCFVFLSLLFVSIPFTQPAFAADSFSSHTKDISQGQNNVYTARDTGAAALAETLHAYETIQILEVRLHLNTAATQETYTVKVDSGSNAVYDALLLSNDLTGDTDDVWRPDYLLLSPSDELDFAWANTDTRTWGLEVKYRKIK